MELDLFSGSPAELTRVLFLDTETTGIEPGSSEVCEIGMLLTAYDGLVRVEGEDRTFESLIRPSGPIPPEASAVHHITDEMVSSAPSMAEVLDRVTEMASMADLVSAHNLPFDLAMLAGSSGGAFPRFEPERMLDTLRLARHLWPELPSHSLQALRYRFGLDRSLGTDGRAHRALFDAVLVMRLVEKVISAGVTDCASMMELAELAGSPIEVLTFGFGKYKGKLLDDIVARDREYIDWLVSQDWARQEHPDLYHTLCRKTGRAGNDPGTDKKG